MRKTHVKKLFAMLAFAFIISSCKKNEGYNTPISSDMSKPGVLTDVKVKNYNGGAYITYNLPNSPNILYVLARYEIREGTGRETKASYFTDTVNVEGFAVSKEYDVNLYVVSRANVMSDPVTVKVHPDIPVYQLVYNKLKLEPDFGGVSVSAQNVNEKEVGIIFSAFDDNTKHLEIQDQHYSKTQDVSYSVRGFGDVPKQFGVFVRDRFGNVSDTLKQVITPLFEEILDKSLFSPYVLPSDVPIGFGWQLPNLWNGTIDGNGWHGASGSPAPWVCTFGVGRSYQLSRVVVFERSEYAFSHGNPKFFTIWGSNLEKPANATLPVSSAEGTVVGDWVNMGNFRFPDPPSGQSPNSITESDRDFVRKGVNFNLNINHPKVRFIRYAVGETWSQDDAPHVMELSFYGSSR